MGAFDLPREAVPDLWVVNAYEDENRFIDWHSDDDRLFDAVENEAAIVSLSFGNDGLFAFRVKAKSALAREVLHVHEGRHPLEEIVKRDLRGAVTLTSGALCLKAGHFQRDFQHCTAPRRAWPDSWATQLLATKRCRTVALQEGIRYNLTGRFVRRHHPACPAVCLTAPEGSPPPPTTPPREVGGHKPRSRG